MEILHLNPDHITMHTASHAPTHMAFRYDPKSGTGCIFPTPHYPQPHLPKIVCGKEPLLQVDLPHFKLETGIDQCCALNSVDPTHMTCTGPDGTGLPQMYVQTDIHGLKIGYGTDF